MDTTGVVGVCVNTTPVNFCYHNPALFRHGSRRAAHVLLSKFLSAHLNRINFCYHFIFFLLSRRKK